MQNVKGPLGSKLNNLCQTIVVVFKIAFDVIFISSSLQRIGIISIHNEHKKNTRIVSSTLRNSKN